MTFAARPLKLLRAAEAEPGTGAPGEVMALDGDALLIACGAGTRLRVLEVQPESRRPMTARAFAAGARLTAGARLG
jgi:methionyl-tRNA formyltransferase